MFRLAARSSAFQSLCFARRPTSRAGNCFAPRSVLREFLRSAKGGCGLSVSLRKLLPRPSVVAQLLNSPGFHRVFGSTQ
jgi:hypothetical protein